MALLTVLQKMDMKLFSQNNEEDFAKFFWVFSENLNFMWQSQSQSNHFNFLYTQKRIDLSNLIAPHDKC